MENLLSSFYNIYQNKDSWDYYNRYKKDEFDLFPDGFIEKYFKDGGKRNVVDEIIESSKSRSQHTISAFFIGILLKESLYFDSLKELKPDFSYLWFLNCLFHDYGYIVESNNEKYPIECTTLETLREKFKISKKRFLLSMWRPKFIPLIFDLNTVLGYFEYCRRKKSNPFINHGHISSILLYDRLIKNFEQKRNDFMIRHNIKQKQNYFIHEEKEWSINDKTYYRFVSETILAHNIWHCTEKKDEEAYRSFKLNNLIDIGQHKTKRINFRDFPLLFLLDLADNVDPIKAFPEINPKCLFEKIAITKIDNGLQFTVLEKCINSEAWFKNIRNLKEWLSISVLNEEENYVQIKIE